MKTNKPVFSNELAYVLALLILSLGTALMATADFGVSMVVAPAYILHLKLSQLLPFFSFGMAEYCLQAVLLVLISLLMKRFKTFYLFSFVTAVLYGFCLDGWLLFVTGIPMDGFVPRLVYFLLGMFCSCIGVSLFFHTYIAPEAYELFVKQLSAHYHIPLTKFKTGYDCVSCLLSILLSFLFFGLWQFEGIKLGTVFCALTNGYLIGKLSAFFDRHWQFKDSLPLRHLFEA